MSSHYIIRDDQEPALFIKEGEAISEKAMFSLLEWNPLVIIDESLIGMVLHHKINVDAVVIQELEEADVVDLLEIQSPFDILKRSNLPQDLLEYLTMKGMHALDIVAPFDSDIIEFAEEVEKVFPVNIFSGNKKYVRCQNHFEKWATSGRGFLLYPYVESIQVQNLVPQKEGAFAVEKEGKISIQSPEPIWVGEVLF